MYSTDHMEDVWKFAWTGKGIETNKTNQGDARLLKTGSVVTMIPKEIHPTLHNPFWELSLTSAPYTPFTTTTTLNSVNFGFYVPDKNYFFPVNLQGKQGEIAKLFYLFLNTQGKFMGLFVSEQCVVISSTNHKLVLFTKPILIKSHLTSSTICVLSCFTFI